MQYSVMLSTFPFGDVEHKAVRNYLIRTLRTMSRDNRISHVHQMDVDDTPITMSRNRVLKEAKAKKVDFVLMIDSDMDCDKYLGYPAARPFWDSTIEFMLQHQGPCVVAAPYCGPPPHENVYVFRWAAYQSNHPQPDLRLEQYPREEAAIRSGFEQVAALPTGLCLIDMRALEFLKPPYFEYEFEDEEQTKKATTEDVFFTRNLSLAGVPQYVNWDAWAGHIKRKVVERPVILTNDAVRLSYREALLRDLNSGERLIDIGAGQPDQQPQRPEAEQCTPGTPRKRKASSGAA